MAAEDDIVQRVVLQGDKAVIQQFNAVGDAGEKAFVRVNSAARATSGAFGTMGGAFGGILGDFRSLKGASEDTANSFGDTARATNAFATTLRILGRATGTSEIGRLGNTVRILGRAFEFAAPAILIAGLVKLASSGTKAAGAFADLADQSGLTNSQMSTFTSLLAGAGVSSDKVGSSLKAVNDIIKQTADNTIKNDNTFRGLNETLASTRQAGDRIVEGFDAIRKASTNAVDQYISAISAAGDNTVAAEAAIRTFNDAQEKERLDLKHLNQDLATNIQKEQDVERSLRAARAEADLNATALEKLGIGVIDTNGKLKKAPGVLLELADALHNITDPVKQQQIEFDLVQAGVDRKLIPALRRGAIAFAALQEVGKKVAPGFDNKDIAVADNFTTSVNLLSSAFSNLIDRMGLAVAPAFIDFFDRLRNVITDITPGLSAFAGSLANVVGPVLAAVVNVISNVVVPAFQGLIGVFDGIAAIINRTFGTQITGVDLFTAALLGVAAAFGGIPVLIGLTVIAFGLLLQMVQDNQIALIAIGIVIVAVVAFFASWPLVIAAVVVAFGLLVDAWNNGGPVVDFIKQKWADFTNAIFGFIDGIKQRWADLQQFISDHTPSFLGGGGGGGTSGDLGINPDFTFAAGGHVRGPGGPRADRIPIWASDGEFMIQAAAVKKYGLGFMQALNNLKLSPHGFDVGGLVSFHAPQPKMGFAAGGLVTGNSGKRPIVLNIDGQSFSMMSRDGDTADRLVRYATTRKVRSAGRKPTYYGGG